jgi:Zn-dependent protease
MHFRVLGFPVVVQGAFWFTAVLLGIFPMLGGNVSSQALMAVPIWVAIVFSGITVHEVGHALVMRHYRLQPEIVLHGFGGATAARGLGGLKRHQRILVSAAGPAAGLLLGGIAWLLFDHLVAPQLTGASPQVEQVVMITFGYLLWVNVGWSIFNLLPILPLDGGHILEDLLGPRRIRTTYLVSLAIGVGIVALAFSFRFWFVAIIIGMFTWNTYGRFRELGDGAPRPRVPPTPPIPPELVAALGEAKRALDDERFEQARTHAELILSGTVPAAVRLEALTIIGWSYLLEGEIDGAAAAVRAIQKQGNPDPALVGAVAFQKGDDAGARAIFEAARAAGDDRKEVVGPLIQILIKQGEVARAAAIALDIVETLSDEDVRQMAEIAAEHQAHAWAARLFEALFERLDRPDDAYEAARHRSLDGDPAGALVLIERAVRAGFSDASRAWSDKALAALRDSEAAGKLEDLLPRPSP